MLRLRKTICLVFMAVLILAMLPQVTLVAHAANYTIVTPKTTNGNYFSALPGVYEMGDGYAVIWATTFEGTGYIEYTYKGQKYTVYDERNGVVRTGDNIHVVKVPHEHLQGNSYTVHSREVTGHNWAITNYGVEASVGPIKLKKYDGGTTTFDFLVLTDVHKQLDWAKKVAQQFKEPDLLVFSGDTVSSLNKKADLVTLFNIMGTISHGADGQIPMVYIRGNHECRGEYSTILLEYLPTETGEYYFDFTYGPLYSVVLDTGEDKADQHIKTSGGENYPRNEYGQLANFAEYHQRQEAWLRSLRKDDSATFRLGIYHIPRIHDLSRVSDTKQNLAQYTEHLGIQFGIAGHTHSLGAYYDSANDSANKLKHTVFQCGGGDDKAETNRFAVMVTMNSTTKKAHVTAKTSSGTAHSTYNNYGINFSTHITAPPEPIEVERGLLNHFDKTKVYPAGTIKLDTQPAVFETGGDWYNVIWKTSYTKSGTNARYSAHGTTGYVEYTYNGKTYQVFDEVGGSRRVFDDYHTVRIPKEHLNNNTYKVGSFVMLYDYVNPSSNSGKFYLAGNYVESPEYLFEDRSGDTAVNLISCPDINMGESGASIANAKNAVAALGTSPAYIILNGNVNWIQYGGAEFTNLINAAATISGSSHPVILSRGHAECRGAVAPNLMKYLPTATGEYYYTVKVGDYTLVNLDTAEDDWDGTTENGVSKYGDRVHLNEKRKEQLAWINSLEDGNLIAISAMPLKKLDSKFGFGYEAALKNKGAVLAIGGHADSFTLYETVDSNSIYTVVPGGNDSGMDVASVLVSGDYAYITQCKYGSDGSTTYPTKKAVCLSDGSTKTITASKPPQSGSVYTVSTPGHMKWIQENCTTTGTNGGHFDGYTFKLANDIDMMLVPFTPIGGCDTQNNDGQSASKAFGGIFDGNGYAIKNLNIQTTNNNVGLFGYLRQATVKNLTISGGMVNAGWYVGGLVGFCSASTVEDCYVDLVVYSPSGSKVGGVAGFTTGESTITRCANYGHITGKASSSIFGGVVGQGNGSKTNYITYCYNRGPVTPLGTSSGCIAGGIVGYTGTAVYQINNCYNAAPVTSMGRCGTITSYKESNTKTVFSIIYYALGYNGATDSGCGNAGPVAQAEMKTQRFAEKLNSSVFTYVANLNDGYPVHWNDIHYGSTAHGPYTSVATTPATCTTPGVGTYTCTCSYSYTGSIAATGHDCAGTVTAPTCTEKGYTTYSCKNCDYSYAANYVAALGHSKKTVAGKEPTCTETGLTDGVICSACNTTITKQEVIPAMGHNHVDYVCTGCGDVLNVTVYFDTSFNGWDKVNAHYWNEDGQTTQWPGIAMTPVSGTVYSIKIPGNMLSIVFNNDTHQTQNLTAPGDGYACNGFQWVPYGQSFTTAFYVTGGGDILGKWDADFPGGLMTSLGGGMYTVTFTNVPAGTYEYKVTAGNWDQSWGYDNGNFSFAISAPSNVTVKFDAGSFTTTVDVECLHSYEAVVTAPTCTEDGFTTYTCPCGDSYTETIPATGHDCAGTVTAPTCTEKGYTTYNCKNCNYSYVAGYVAAQGHDEKTIAGKAPTCTETGLTDGVVCSTCNTTITEQEEIPATGKHIDADNSGRCDTCGKLMQPAKLRMASISMNGNIAINYYMLLSDEVINDPTAYMQFTMADGTIIQIPVSESIDGDYQGETYYMFSCTVDAKEMTDDVLCQFFYNGGSTEPFTYSVQTYAKRILENSTNDNMKALLRAMLNYGAASQTHFGYRTDDLANDGLEAPDYSGVTIEGFKAVAGQGTELAKFYSASLILKSETTLRFFFQVDSSAAFTATYNGQTLEVKQRSGLYYVDVVGIAAKDLDENVTITISDGTNTTDVSFNPMSYCQGVLNDTTGSFGADMKNLVRALYLYNQAANVYFKEN